MKKYIYAVMAVAMAMTSCSEDAGLLTDNTTVPDKVYNTTTLLGSRSTFGEGQDQANANGKKSVKRRTVVNLNTWEVGWNDGSTDFNGYYTFGEQGITGENGEGESVDYIEFLKTGGSDWEFLTDDNNRQVFVLDRILDSHTHEGGGDDAHANCCADFTVARYLWDEPTNYVGLDPYTTYHGYYYPPFILEGSMPLSSDCPYYDAVANDYDTDGVPVANYSLYCTPKSFDKNVQAFISQHDILDAYVHGTNRRDICPKRDGVYNATTNSYDLQLDFRHRFALVEIDFCFAEAPVGDGHYVHFTNAKIDARNDDNTQKVVFYNSAYLNGQADWEYRKVSTCQCYRADRYTSYSEITANSFTKENQKMAAPIDGKPTVRFFLFVDQFAPCDYYDIQIFSGTNYRGVTFRPTPGFKFEAGKYYRFQLDTDMKGVITRDNWQNAPDTSLKLVYPAQNN